MKAVLHCAWKTTKEKRAIRQDEKKIRERRKAIRKYEQKKGTK